MSALLLACPEMSAISVASFGLFLVVFGGDRSQRRGGAVLALAATLYFVVVMTLVIPAFQRPAAQPGWVDIVIAQGTRVLASADFGASRLAAAGADLTLHFMLLEETRDVEFRTRSRGSGLVLRRVTLLRLDPPRSSHRRPRSRVPRGVKAVLSSADEAAIVLFSTEEVPMASIRRQGESFEIRECLTTDSGPRQRALARFRGVLTPEVLDAAAAAARRPFDRQALLEQARRRGIPVALERHHAEARRLLAQLRDGQPLDPTLVGLLRRELELLAVEPLPSHLQDAAEWVGQPEAVRGKALRGLLRTASRVLRSRGPLREPPPEVFPRFSSGEPRA